MITPEQVRSFNENGYLIIRGLLPEAEIKALRGEADRLQADALAKIREPDYLAGAKFLSRDWIENPADGYVYRQKPDGAYSFHRAERMFRREPLWAQMAMSPRLLASVWSVLGRPFWPRGGSLVYKLPHEGAEVRWHQDIPYLYWSSGGHTSKGRPTTHPVPNFNVDIYLEPSNEGNGCLWAIPGSHLNGTVDVDHLVAAHGWNIPRAMPLEIEPGDVMLHHVAVVHGSPENRGPNLRRTFYIHYMTDETLRDAYSDWPDLLSSQENVARWSAALDSRQAGLGPAAEAGWAFAALAEGITPVHTPHCGEPAEECSSSPCFLYNPAQVFS